jgi:cation transport regulator ChaC
VDYVIETTEENYTAQLEAFKWNSVINAANGVNSSLYESIRNTLQEVKPTGILYSYYLKLEPNSK